MVTHQQLLEHLRQTGFKISGPTETTTGALRFYGGSITVQLWSASHKGKGVRVRWFGCDDDSRKDQIQCQSPNPHVHYETYVRTELGGLKSITGFSAWQPPLKSLDEIDKLQGHSGPVIGKTNLPEPYKFGEQRFYLNRNQHGVSCRHNVVINYCLVAGIVGLRNDARIDVKAAATPDEEPWFHLDCMGTQGATFDIITNGEVWYPLDRKSKRITTNMAPKASVDLTQMGPLDKELVLHAIHAYVEGLG